MAKANSLITLRGTYDGMTFVKSSAYGNHVRAARGTRKKAVLNEACQAQSEKLVKSNLPAQIIRDAINPYRQDFYYGLLWQKLVSHTNDVLEKDKPFDFSRLKPFEAHKKYRLTRLAEVTTSTKSDLELSKLQVTVSLDTTPVFDNALSIDGFRLGVIVLFPDLEKQSAKTDAVYSDIISLKEKVVPFPAEFTIPAGAKSFLVFVRIDGAWEGELNANLAAKGMRMVEAGRV